MPQGITGIVSKSVGDFQCCPPHGKTYALSVPVHVARGRVPYVADAPIRREDLDVVITLHSDADGRFGVGLLPGTYTTFAEIDGALYLNCTRESEQPTSYCWQDVASGQFVDVQIDDNSEATY